MPADIYEFNFVGVATLFTEMSFLISGGVVDGEDGVVNEPMQWVVTVYKNAPSLCSRHGVYYIPPPRTFPSEVQNTQTYPITISIS